VFNQLVFDAFIPNNETVYTDASYNALLGAPDQLSVFAVIDQVNYTTAGTVLLSVGVEMSGDNRLFGPKLDNPIIDGEALTVGTTNIQRGYDDGTIPGSGYVRLTLALGGTAVGPSAHVRLYATGRGQFPL
jgi:hypothetical protein